MIKVIAFDLVGVLVNEKDIELTNIEEKLERMFGDNLNDSDYLIEARKQISKDVEIIQVTEDIMNKLYKIRDKDLFKKLKEKYKGVKVVIATNHLSFVKKFIEKSFDMHDLDAILISAEMHKIKPNADFYEHILNRFHIQPQELLFLDDNIKNVNGAEVLGISVIKVEKDMDLYKEICKFLDK